MPKQSHAANRRALLACLGAALLAGPGRPFAAEADWPSAPIRFIVPYAPGATTDLVARTVAQRVAALLGRPMLVDNIGGAGGNLGMAAVARAKPDGYTIGMGAISTNALNPHVYKSMAFDPRKDFSAVGMLGSTTGVLVVGPGEPATTVAQLVVNANAKPGMPYASPGIGTALHLAGVLFSEASGARLSHVPYKGSAPAINDLLGGQVGVMFDNLPSALPHIRSGKLRALAVTTERRSPLLPDVPTLREAGFGAAVIAPWFAVFAPAGTAAHIIERLNKAFNEALADPAVRQPLVAAGFDPAGSSPHELQTFVQQEWLRFDSVARKTPLLIE